MSGSVRLLLIDNYDSFTYNLVQAFMVLGAEVDVRRNDDHHGRAGEGRSIPTHLCISPGPGTPYDAGVSMDMIRAFAGSGAGVRRVPGAPVHRRGVRRQGSAGRRGSCTARPRRSTHDGKGLFAGLPASAEVGRYHSLIAKPDTLPAELEVTARTPEGEIMGVRHRTLKVEGVQFHPESVLTPDGPAAHRQLPASMSGGRQ